MDQLAYLPVTAPFFALLAGLAAFVVVLLQIGVLRYAYRRIGLDPFTAFLVLIGSLFGSYFNVPIWMWPGQQAVSGAVVSYFGVDYVVPVVTGSPGTVLALNVGGAVVPTFVSLWLVLRNGLAIRSLVAIAAVALITHQVAQPVRGLGIALPIFVPAAAATAAALLLSTGRAAPLAYVGGSLGTLVGADLLNLGRIEAMGAPVASIGGAGTFDGIFVSAILAVLVASLPDALLPERR